MFDRKEGRRRAAASAASPRRQAGAPSEAPRSPVKTPTEKALERHEADIAVLVHIARCDGLFHQVERDVVSDYVGACAADLDFDPVAVYRHICSLYPDQKAFHEALTDLRGNPRRLRAVAKVCLKLVCADGVRAVQEDTAMARVRLAVGDAA